MNHIFNSLSDYYDFLTQPNPNPRPHPGDANDPDFSFYQTKNLTEALDLLRNGTTDSKYDLCPKSAAALPTRTHSNRKVPTTAPVGFVPHVPNALLNLPNSMISTRLDPRQTAPSPRQSITIVRDVSYPCNVPAERIRELNLATTEYIRSLLLINPQPILTVYAHIGTSLSRSGEHHIYVRVKAPDQRLVIPQLNFAFCHPSFLRRCYCRWVEVSRDVPYVPEGYGTPISAPRSDAFPNTNIQWIFPNESVPRLKK